MLLTGDGLEQRLEKEFAMMEALSARVSEYGGGKADAGPVDCPGKIRRAMEFLNV